MSAKQSQRITKNVFQDSLQPDWPMDNGVIIIIIIFSMNGIDYSSVIWFP